MIKLMILLKQAIGLSLFLRAVFIYDIQDSFLIYMSYVIFIVHNITG
jgi:hypothetical protein